MPLTFGEVFKVTDNGDTDSNGDVAYAPDRSVWVYYTRTSFAANRTGLYLRKRKRNKQWLDEIRVDTMTGDTAPVDADANPPENPNGNRTVFVDGNGDVHLAWVQTGRAGSANRTICYRKLSNDGDEDSYGTPSDVYFRDPTAGGIGQTIALAVDPIDKTIWFAYFITAGSLPGIFYKNEVESALTLPSGREQGMSFVNGGTVTSATAGPAIEADPNGGIHVAYFEAQASNWAIDYAYRAHGDLKKTAAPESSFRNPQLVAGSTGAAAETRNHLSIMARGEADVRIGFEYLFTGTNHDIYIVARTQPGGPWASTKISDGTSVQRWALSIEGQAAPGYALAIWTQHPATSGLYYSEERAGSWSAQALGVLGTVAGVRTLNSFGDVSSQKCRFRTFARTPFQLGFQNPVVGQVVTVWSQNDV